MSGKDTDNRDNKVQGEGDYDAARRYRKDVKEYLQNNDPKPAAEKAEAAVKSGERKELDEAERKGKSKARH